MYDNKFKGKCIIEKWKKLFDLSVMIFISFLSMVLMLHFRKSFFLIKFTFVCAQSYIALEESDCKLMV